MISEMGLKAWTGIQRGEVWTPLWPQNCLLLQQAWQGTSSPQRTRKVLAEALGLASSRREMEPPCPWMEPGRPPPEYRVETGRRMECRSMRWGSVTRRVAPETDITPRSRTVTAVGRVLSRWSERAVAPPGFNCAKSEPCLWSNSSGPREGALPPSGLHVSQ